MTDETDGPIFVCLRITVHAEDTRYGDEVGCRVDSFIILMVMEFTKEKNSQKLMGIYLHNF